MSNKNEMINNYDYGIGGISSQKIIISRPQLFYGSYAQGLDRVKVRESNNDFVRSHHLVVFMFEDVTMPDIQELLPRGYGCSMR